MDAVRIFAEIVAQRRAVSANYYKSHHAFGELMNEGFLETKGLVGSVLCDDCSSPHTAEVVCENQSYGYYCPDLGFIEIDRDDLIAVQPDIEKFIEQVAEELDCKRRKSSPVQGDVWRVGQIETPSATLAVYFKATFQNEDDFSELAAALSREVKAKFGIILTAKGALENLPYKTICLEDFLSFDQKIRRFTIDVDLPAAAGVPSIRKGGRPNKFKDLVVGLHAERTTNGKAQSGLNAEARDIQNELKKRRPEKKSPSISTIKSYISKP